MPCYLTSEDIIFCITQNMISLFFDINIYVDLKARESDVVPLGNSICVLPES